MPTYQIALIVLAFIGAGIYGFIMNKKMKAGASAFLEQHPDAARLFTTYNTNGLSAGSVTIESVNGQKPTYGHQGNKAFAYVAPGTSIVEATFSNTRPGVMHKSVTKVWGPVKLELEIKPNASYELQFDKKAEEFQLVEI